MRSLHVYLLAFIFMQPRVVLRMLANGSRPETREDKLARFFETSPTEAGPTKHRRSRKDSRQNAVTPSGGEEKAQAHSSSTGTASLAEMATNLERFTQSQCAELQSALQDDSFDIEKTSLWEVAGIPITPSQGAWLLTGVATACALATLMWSFKVIRSDYPASFRIKYIVALMSVPQWLIVPLPLMSSSVKKQMGVTVVACYKWIPFWNIFCVTDLFGAWVNFSWDMFWGTLLGYLVIIPLNWVMPAGQACISDEVCRTEQASQAMMEFNMAFALLYAVAMVYLCSVSRSRIDHKRCYLCAFLGLFVEWCNPAGDWRSMTPVMIDWDFSIHWKGFALVGMGIIIVAFGLRIPLQFCFPMETIMGKGMSFFCLKRAESALHQYSQDVAYSLFVLQELWITDTWSYEVSRCEKIIAGLKDQEENIEMILDYGWWEAYFPWQVTTLRYQIWHKEFLHSLRRVFVSSLYFLKQCVDSSEDEAKFSAVLNTLFHQNWVQFKIVTEALCNYTLREEERLGKMEEAIQLGVKTRSHALEELCRVQAEAGLAMDELCEQLGYTVLMTEWTHVLRDAVDLFASRPRLAWPDLGILSFPQSLFMRSTHLAALRHVIGALLSLWWIRERRHWASGVCVISYSFMIQQETRLYDAIGRSVNRFIGAAAGLIASNMPVTWLCRHLKYFVYSPQYCIVYYILIGFIWLVSAYGSLASKEYGYAFMLFGAFGSMEMLRPLEAISDIDQNLAGIGTAIRAKHFRTLMDVFVSVVVAFLVDAAFAFLANDTSQKQAATEVAEVLERCAQSIEQMHAGKCPTASDIRTLNKSVNSAKNMCVQASAELGLWQVTWKTAVSDTVLAECTTFCSLMHTISLSWNRLSDMQRVSKMRQLLPPSAADDFRLFARTAQHALNQNIETAPWGLRAQASGTFGNDRVLKAIAKDSPDLRAILEKQAST